MKKENNQIRKQNMKIYSIYRMLSVDHIFYYAVEFLFLNQVKNISAADIVFAFSMYALFRTILQIPAVIVVDRLGNRKATVIANIFLAAFVLLVLNSENVWFLIFAQFIDSIGFSLKEASDTTLLNNSIPETSKKSEIFSKLEGKGIKNYYYFTAIASIIAGILYEFNPYIPMIISFIISSFATIISLGFGDIIVEENDKKSDNKKMDFKTYFKDLKDAFKFIVKSNRLKALLLYTGIMWGVITLMSTYTTSLLEELGTTAFIIAISSAIKEISSGLGANKQFEFHNRFKNKSLTVILIINAICIIGIGLVGVLNLNIITSIVLIIILSIFINYVRGIHEVLSTTYLQNFTTPRILTKIYAMNSISRNLFRVVISLFGSFLLRFTNTANSTIIFGVVFVMIIIWLVVYMKTRLGLKPEDYKIEDIKFK